MKIQNRQGSGKHFLRWALLLYGCLTSAAFAAVDGGLETKVKAAYLYHLIKFVEWPSPSGEAFRVCVHGSETIGGMLGELSNRQVRDRPLKIEIEGDPARCQLLYIGRGDKDLPDLLARTRRLPILTVSDADEFARRGGIVGFYSEAGKIRLEINPEAARAANLRISAKLMELARTVTTARE